MSTNEQDRTDGAGSRLVLSDKRSDRTTLVLVERTGAYAHIDIDRVGGQTVIEQARDGLRVAVPIADVALDAVIDGLQHLREARDAEEASADERLLEVLRESPEQAESLAVAAGERAALSEECPTCASPAGVPCSRYGDHSGPHPDRVYEATVGKGRAA